MAVKVTGRPHPAIVGYASPAAANVAWCSTVRPKLRAALADYT